MEPDAAAHLVSLKPGDEFRQGGALSDGKVVNLLVRWDTSHVAKVCTSPCCCTHACACAS